MPPKNNTHSNEHWKSVAIARPVTVKSVSEALNLPPFTVVANLMALNCFATITTEIADELLFRLGELHCVKFTIKRK